MFQILAMGGPPNPNQPPAVQFISSILPIALIFVVFYFMLIRPQQKKKKEMDKMITELKSGDKIVTSGGILGTVTNVKDKTVIIRIADNVKVEILRSAVQTVTQKATDSEAAGGKN